MDAFATRDLLSFLASVPDPRSRHGRQHPLSAILALVVRFTNNVVVSADF